MKEIKKLLAITQKLKGQYKRSFTLDGRLVGDIVEVLAAAKYGLKLYEENTPVHDAEEVATGRKVQIKSTMKGYSYFPCGELPDYFLSVLIKEDGSLEELFNGPGQFIMENYILKRKLKPYKKSYYSLAKGILLDLNNKVNKAEKISKA